MPCGEGDEVWEGATISGPVIVSVRVGYRSRGDRAEKLFRLLPVSCQSPVLPVPLCWAQLDASWQGWLGKSQEWTGRQPDRAGWDSWAAHSIFLSLPACKLWGPYDDLLFLFLLFLLTFWYWKRIVVDTHNIKFTILTTCRCADRGH